MIQVHYLILSVLMILSYGCNKSKVQKLENEIKSLSTQLNKSKELYKIQLEKTENLNKENIYLKQTLNDISELNKNLRYELSPLGLKIASFFGSDDDRYIFFSDSLMIFEYPTSMYKIGKWTMRYDTIAIEYFKLLGKRGVGNVLPNYGANVPAVFDEYVDYVEIIEEEEKLSWSEIKDYLKKDNEYPYEILETNTELDFSKFNFNLPGKYNFLSIRHITEEELTEYDKKELRIMKNEIFARYGYVFKSNDLNNYFQKTNWYRPAKKDVDYCLSEIEKHNIDIIIGLINK